MQLAFAAVAKLAGALGLGGGGAAAAGATSAGLGGAQTLVSALSALGTLGSGLAAASASRDMADQVDLSAGQDKVEATQRQTQMKRSLMQVLGENDVAFASAGIDISGGIAQTTRNAASKRGVEEITIDRRDSDFRRALYKARASGYRRQAGSQIGGALLGALGGLGNAALDGAARGGAGVSMASDPWAGLRVT